MAGHTPHVDLCDAASESVHRLGVVLGLLRQLANHPSQDHGGYVQAVAQEVIEQCRDVLTAGLKTDDVERTKARGHAKKGGAR